MAYSVLCLAVLSFLNALSMGKGVSKTYCTPSTSVTAVPSALRHLWTRSFKWETFSATTSFTWPRKSEVTVSVNAWISCIFRVDRKRLLVAFSSSSGSSAPVIYSSSLSPSSWASDKVVSSVPIALNLDICSWCFQYKWAVKDENTLKVWKQPSTVHVIWKFGSKLWVFRIWFKYRLKLGKDKWLHSTL